MAEPKSLAIAYAMKKKSKMARGGSVDRDEHIKGVHTKNYEGEGNSPMGSFTKAAKYGNTSVPKHELHDYAKKEHVRVSEDAASMPKPNLKGLAHGGSVGDDFI